MAKVPVQLTLNGTERAEFIDGGLTLLNALRDRFGDTSPKGGCHQGTCGACSAIVDGELRLSCLTLAETCNGADDDCDGVVDEPQCAGVNHADFAIDGSISV